MNILLQYWKIHVFLKKQQVVAAWRQCFWHFMVTVGMLAGYFGF